MKLFATSILALLGLATVTSALDDLDDKACNEGEKQCILKGQMIDQCINGKWAIVKVCKPGDVCVENPTALCVLKPVQKGTSNAKPYPQCVGVKAVEAREEDGDEDSVDTVSSMTRPFLNCHAVANCSQEQANKAEMPCSKCKKFREQCNTVCSIHQPFCFYLLQSY